MDRILNSKTNDQDVKTLYIKQNKRGNLGNRSLKNKTLHDISSKYNKDDYIIYEVIKRDVNPKTLNTEHNHDSVCTFLWCVGWALKIIIYVLYLAAVFIGSFVLTLIILCIFERAFGFGMAGQLDY